MYFNSNKSSPKALFLAIFKKHSETKFCRGHSPQKNSHFNDFTQKIGYSSYGIMFQPMLGGYVGCLRI